MVVQMQVLSVGSVEMAPSLMLATESERCVLLLGRDPSR